MKKSVDIYFHIWYNVNSERHDRHQDKTRNKFSKYFKKVLTTDSENDIMSTVESLVIKSKRLKNKASDKKSLKKDKKVLDNNFHKWYNGYS